MRLLKNILSQEDIDIFRDYWEKNNQHTYINAWTNAGHPHANRSDFIDRRLLILPNTRAGDVVKRVVDQIWPGENQILWANFQQQSICHMLHVDEYGKDRTNPTWTIILALDTQPKWKAVIFQEQFNSGADLVDYISNKINYSLPPRNNSSDEHDLQHMDNWRNGINFNPCHWLEVDGVFTYCAGDGVLFDTNQAHTTNNWVKYPEFQYRQLVQIHVGKPASTCTTFIDKGGGERPPDEHWLKDQLIK